MPADIERFPVSLPNGYPEMPFSDAVRAGNTLYISGKIGFDLATGKPPASPEDEARLVMTYFRNSVEGAGFTMDQVVSVQIFATDLSLFGLFNEVYREFFPNGLPSRAFLGTASLLGGGRFEVLGTAVRE